MDLTSLILVVDDDPDLRKLITEFLGEHGYRVEAVENVAQMRVAMEREQPDLVILDVMMPGEDGLSAARQLAGGKASVIMLSALGSDTDRIIGLEVGADDYLSKPCNPRELLARVRAHLRRRPGAAGAAAPEPQGNIYQFAGWRLDVVRRDLRDPTGVFINLSDGEFSLLRAFVERPQRVLSRDQLLDQMRGHEADVYDRAVDSQISRLRRKINGRTRDELIRTVRNEGYMLLPAVTRL
ncbi:MAG: response regulator transcription factor [Pseudoxanthomonas sp.]